MNIIRKMRALALIFSFLFGVVHLSTAQKYDYVWPMGYGDDPPNGWGISKLDFNGPSVRKEFLFAKKTFQFSDAGSFICDADGELVLLSDGCSVMDARANILPNGSGLNPGPTYDSYCDPNTSDQYYPVINGNFFITCPSWGDHYILIHQDGEPNRELQDVICYNVYYSLIAKNQNNKFEVIKKNISINPSWSTNTSLCAVEHGDGDKWWICFPAYYQDKIYLALMDKNGMVSIDSQSIGLQIRHIGDGFGFQTRFSPDGRIHVTGKFGEAIYLYDFDRTLGKFSNLRKIRTPLDSAFVRGSCFSPDSRFLYITQDTFLYQYDLWASDIESSVVEIGHVFGFTASTGWPYGLGTMFLGPDCRIYVSPASSCEIMHVIHHPNRKGKDCGFEPAAITMPTRLAFSVPNIMTFRTTAGRQLCDSTKGFLSTSVTDVFYDFNQITVQPNPADDYLTISFDAEKEAGAIFKIVDISGRERWSQSCQGGNMIRIPVGHFSPGLYILTGSHTGQNIKFIISHEK